jgi:hypothetical protein
LDKKNDLALNPVCAMKYGGDNPGTGFAGDY